MQRTFEGAYLRTALSQLSFALVVLKLFDRRFLPIGTTFTVYGLLVILIALYRRTAETKVVLNHEGYNAKFSTGGDTVLLLGLASMVSYVVLIVLLVRLDK